MHARKSGKLTPKIDLRSLADMRCNHQSPQPNDCLLFDASQRAIGIISTGCGTVTRWLTGWLESACGQNAQLIPAVLLQSAVMTSRAGHKTRYTLSTALVNRGLQERPVGSTIGWLGAFVPRLQEFPMAAAVACLSMRARAGVSSALSLERHADSDIERRWLCGSVGRMYSLAARED